MIFIFKFLIYFIDIAHKKRIIQHFKKIFNNKPINVIDVGAHKGETIKLFSKNFNLKSIVSYEASKKNFLFLKKFENINFDFELKIKNIALGSVEKKMDFFQTSESSSSTFCKIDFNSKYYKRKKKILDFFYNQDYILNKESIQLHTLYNEFKEFNSNKIDILKIDTEGFEFDVIKGTKEKIASIKYIYFEHHFDLMIIKDYKFSEIHDYLTKYNFKKMIKIKMPLRKTFEYIYENQS
jgi:FkbM family methyltransferase